MLMDGAIVDDGVDRLARGNLLLNDIEEAKELLMAMTLHVAADHLAVENVHRGEQGRRAVPLIVVRHGSGAPLLQRQSGLCTVKRLNLALFVDRQDDGVCALPSSPSGRWSNGSFPQVVPRESARRRARPSRPERLDARGARLVAQQSIDPLLDKALLPAPNAGFGLPGSSHDFVRADPIGGQQHDLSPPHVLLRHVAVLN
jgi:hypothetical protein